MRAFLLLLSLLVVTTATSWAKIYTWKDASGRTIYGDTPPEQKKAKEVKTQELTIVPGFKDPSLEAKTAKPEQQEDEEEFTYKSFKVSYPNNDEAIRANDGNITIAFELEPALQANDSVSIYLDGKKIVEDGKSLSTSLSNLDRGSHSLFAVVKNNKGDVLLNSNTVSFHMLRNSIITNPATNPGSPTR